MLPQCLGVPNISAWQIARIKTTTAHTLQERKLWFYTRWYILVNSFTLPHSTNSLVIFSSLEKVLPHNITQKPARIQYNIPIYIYTHTTHNDIFYWIWISRVTRVIKSKLGRFRVILFCLCIRSEFKYSDDPCP